MGKLMIRNADDSAWITIAGVGTVVQQDAEPATPHAGMMWLDTDATTGLQSEIRDTDGDTYITCEKTADADVVNIGLAGVGGRVDIGKDATDAYPMVSILPYGHDNINISLDAYFDGAAWRSSVVGSNFLMQKLADAYSIQADTGNTAGETIPSWDILLRIAATGEVTMPNQPSFLAGNITAAMNDISVATMHTIKFNQILDVGDNYDNATWKFTAPVTGRYHFEARVTLMDWADDAISYYLTILTSNRSYHKIHIPDMHADDTDYVTLTISAIADLDENDDAYVGLQQGGGTVQTDIYAATEYTVFSGYLLG